MTDDSKDRPPTSTDQDPATIRSEADAKSQPLEREEATRVAGVDVQAYIGRQLRAVYDDVANQPVPDRFLALMKQLEDVKPLP